MCRRLAALLVVAAAAWGQGAPVARGQSPALLDEMAGPRPVFRLLPGADGIYWLRQAVGEGEGRFGDCEHIVLAIPAGSSAYLAYGIPPAAVIDELRLETTAWCPRPGLQLAATVALPRSIDPSTGQPRELLVRAGEMARAAEWATLRLA
ncbi:MAG TPA: hypothetical protein PJ982_14855, partial [Lacipirellulaceae bacterium]|nr:hypothetical protein [Lacipirellulaceae bacterium]